MASGTRSWRAPRGPDDLTGRFRIQAVARPLRGPSPLRRLPTGVLEEPVQGAALLCQVCRGPGKRLRRLNYPARPWLDAYRRLPAGALVHYRCATVPDVDLGRSFPQLYTPPGVFLGELRFLQGARAPEGMQT